MLSEHSQKLVDDAIGRDKGKHHAYYDDGGYEMGHITGSLDEFFKLVVAQFIDQQGKKDWDKKGEGQVQETEPESIEG